MEALVKFNEYVTVEIATFLFCYTLPLMQFGIQDLLYQKICFAQELNETLCHDKTWLRSHKDIEGETSLWIMYSNIVLIIPSTISAVIQGRYIDRHGFGIPLRLPLFGSIASFLLLALISWTSWHHGYIFLGMLILGISGGSPAFIMAMNAYVIKDSEGDDRPMRIAVVSSCLALGTAVGIACYGPVIDNLGLPWLFIAATAPLLISLADVTLRLRRPLNLSASEDELKDEDEAADKISQIKSVLDWDSLKAYMAVLTKERDFFKRRYMFLSVLVFILSFCALIGVIDVEFLYLTREKNFSNTQVSIFMSVGNMLTLVGNIVGIYILKIRLEVDILFITAIGSVASAVNYAGLSLSDSTMVFWVINALRFFTGMTSIGSRSYISECIDITEQGVLMSFLGVTEAVFKLIASLIFNGLYTVTLPVWPGMVLMLAAIFCVIGLPVLAYIKWHESRLDPPYQNMNVMDRRVSITDPWLRSRMDSRALPRFHSLIYCLM